MTKFISQHHYVLVQERTEGGQDAGRIDSVDLSDDRVDILDRVDPRLRDQPEAAFNTFRNYDVPVGVGRETFAKVSEWLAQTAAEGRPERACAPQRRSGVTSFGGSEERPRVAAVRPQVLRKGRVIPRDI